MNRVPIWWCVVPGRANQVKQLKRVGTAMIASAVGISG
jgi:hypothetical protein